MSKLGQKRFLLAALICLCMLLHCTVTVANPVYGNLNGDNKTDTDNALLEAHFIDVGQGDSILVIAPNRKTILIDAGDRKESQTVLSYLGKQLIDKIDIVISTHPHADHIGGLIGILDKITVGLVIDSGYPHTSKTYEDYLTRIEQKDIPFTLARSGDVIDLDPSVSIRILHPGKGKKIESYAKANNASIVIEMVHGQVGFLFTGDAEKEAESEILECSDFSGIQILKVGHHGSRSSSSDQFLQVANPSVAVIMCGAGNPYGHPHQETLDTLKRRNMDIFRTDLHGDIVIRSDGQTYTVETGTPHAFPAIIEILKYIWEWFCKNVLLS